MSFGMISGIAAIVFFIIFMAIIGFITQHKVIKDGMDDIFKMEGDIFKRATDMREQFGFGKEPNEVSEQKQTICEYCGASVDADATSCSKCGARINRKK